MPLKRRRHYLLMLLAAASAAAAQDPAPEPQAPPVEAIPVAEPAAATPPADPDATVLDDIVVTAERRVATLRETPISMEVFNSEKLALRGIDGLRGLAANVPSMTLEPFPTHNATLRMFIRGVGTADAQVTQDPAVGVYIDGVYIARSVGLSADLADLERIEVLRGPQGTLYGRNTTGGAVNLVTRRPSPGAFTMAHQLTGGERGLLLGKSSVNVPLTDDLAVKLAVLGDVKDGFVENAGRGGDFGDRREAAIRFDTRWLAGDWLTVDYTYDRSDLRYYNGQFQGVVPPNTNHGLGEYFKEYAQTQTTYSDRRLDTLNTGMPMELSRSLVQGHALTLTAPLGGIELKYIGAWRDLTDDQYVDLGGGAGSLEFRLDTHTYAGASADMAYGGPTPLVIPQVFQTQTSHELQLSGALLDDSLEYIVGAFQFEEDGGENGHPLHHILNALADPSQMPPEVRVAFDPFVPFGSPRLVAYWDYDYGLHNTARAVFTQLTWTPPWLERRLHLTGGLRKSWDERHALKNFIQTVYAEGNTAGGSAGASEVPRDATPGNDIFVDERGDARYTDLSPSAIVRYDASKNASVYISNSRAYKSGGFNLRDPQIDGSEPAADGETYGFGYRQGFRPEYVQSWELGLKSDWFERRLRLNVDVFDSHFTDMQTNFLIAGSISDTKARNVGKARMQGVELESAFVALPGLTLALSGAYLDAEVTEALDINGVNKADLYPFVSAPPASGVASVDWTFFDRDWLALRFYAAYHYMGKRQGVVIVEERRDLTALYPFGTYDARLLASGLRFAGGALELALWGRNLTDEEYPVFAIDNTPQADRSVLWGEPRTLGLDLAYRYF
jgi:iron complex outermembrane recepter protein